MALQLFDRVLVTATANTTVSFTLGSAVAGYQSFSVMTNGDTTYYGASDGTNWEVGIGTYSTTGPTLTRTTILSSSNSGSAVTFSGTPNVWIDYPAGKSVYEDASNNVTLPGTLTSTGITTPSVTATTNDLTLSAISTGAVNFNTLNGTALKATDSGSPSQVNYVEVQGGPSGQRALITSNGSDGNVPLVVRTKGTSAINFATNASSSNIQASVSHTASAVNFVQVSGAATTASPTISAQGSDGNVALQINSKSAGTLSLGTGGGTQFRVGHIASAVNVLQVAGSATGFAPVLSTLPLTSDTNVSMALRTTGTGAIDLAAGSSGVNISNGGTVTAITRTSSGGNYTSIPSCVISAPTTAGGVQATVSLIMAAQSGTAVTPANGGTGYTLNDVLTLVGGTFAAVAQFIVTGVSAGVVTQVTRSNTNFGNYTVLPTSPAATTGGTGTGCTLNMLWEFLTTSFTNAGSGYIEQPTITFSGGGGSGASAYAQIGTATVFRSLANMGVFTGGGQQFGVLDSVATSTAYWNAIGGAGTADLRTNSGSTGGAFISNGAASNINFRTNINTSSATQTVIAHTASAVNYVQVTGAATGGSPTISTQGSDGNAGLVVQSKGTSPLFLVTTGSTDIRIQPNNLRSLSIQSVGSAVNYGVWTNSAAGFAPALSVAGTDTDIDLALTPKGAGKVRFGTRTASADVAITGYIEIKDAGGTVRRLAVVG